MLRLLGNDLEKLVLSEFFHSIPGHLAAADDECCSCLACCLLAAWLACFGKQLA